MARRVGGRYVPKYENIPELDLCPFCDSVPTMCRQVKLTYSRINKTTAIDFFWVRCPCCKCRSREFELEDDAVWAWNFRKYTRRRIEEEVDKALHFRRKNKSSGQIKPRKSGKKEKSDSK